MRRLNNEDKITKRQICASAAVCLLSPAIRLLPLRAVQFSGRSAWVSTIVSIPLGMAYVFFMEKLMKKRGDGEGLSELIIKSIGNAAGRIVLGIFALWFTFYCGFVLRSAAERMLSSVFANGNPAFFMLITLTAAFIAASGKVKSLARTGQVFVIIIGVMLIGVTALSAADIKKEYLLPVTYMDSLKILIGILPVIDIMGIYSFFLFLEDHVIKMQSDSITGIKWIALLGITIFAITFVTIGAESAGFLVNNTNPFFVMIRNAAIFSVAERIESVVVALWVLTDFLFLSVLLVIARKTAGKAFGMKSDKKLLLPIVVVSYLVAELITRSSFGMRIYSKWIVPASSMMLAFVVLPVILIIGKIRKRI